MKCDRCKEEIEQSGFIGTVLDGESYGWIKGAAELPFASPAPEPELSKVYCQRCSVVLRKLFEFWETKIEVSNLIADSIDDHTSTWGGAGPDCLPCQGEPG